MIFQPTSPLRSFHQRIRSHNRTPESTGSIDAIMSPKDSRKSTASRPVSKTLSQADTIIPSEPSQSTGVVDNHVRSWQQGLTRQSEGTLVNNPTLANQLKGRRESAGTTNSSPTDPAYMPTRKTIFVVPSVPDDEELDIVEPPVLSAEHSFFDSDTECSDDNSPVIGRASSVRTAVPRIIRNHHKSVASTGNIFGQHSHTGFGRPLFGVSEVMQPEQAEFEDASQSSNMPPAMSQDIGARNTSATPLLPTAPPVPESPVQYTPITTKLMYGGLRSNPITEGDMAGVHRSNTVPLPKDKVRKVRIRPSDLVVTHEKENSHFRETVVSTPYPMGGKPDEPYSQAEKKHIFGSISSRIPPSRDTTSLRTHRRPHSGNTDRFPSPHQPEILFLNLSVARNPCMNMTLEIKIIDKDTFDDEMLFRQLKAAYNKRLLGWSRLLFRLVRSISYVTATSTTSNNINFNKADFTRHLSNPRIGTKRKTWTIWLRNHNRQDSPISPRQDTDHFTVQKRPLPIRPAEKRLSMHSDSTTSLFDFSGLPPLSIARIPFFRDRLSQPQTQAKDVEKQGLTDNKLGRPSMPRIDTTSAITALPSLPPSHDNNHNLTLNIHHKFNLYTLAFFFLLTILSSITATTLWIIFGVPGNRPGQEGANFMSGDVGGGMQMQWEFSAQRRVLTGLVLGDGWFCKDNK